MKCSVEIKRLQVHAPVGVYPQEKALGNDLEVTATLMLDMNLDSVAADDLAATVDYSLVVNIINTTLKEPFNLLEAAALTIARRLKDVPAPRCRVETVTVKVAKLNPPIPGAVMQHASATVTI